jgi:hypothetical protein
MAGAPAYASREDVQLALESAGSSGQTYAIDGALLFGARAMERSARPGLGRALYPRLDTWYEDWPDRAQTGTGRLYVGQPIISLTSVTSGGVALNVATDIILRPAKDEPCAHIIEINRAGSGSLSVASTSQRSIALAGWRGYHDEQLAVGVLSGAVASAGITSVDVEPTFGYRLPGVGDLLAVGSERMIVTDKRMVDSGINLGDDLAALLNDTQVSVADGTAFAIGEMLLIGSERMWIFDIVENALHVRRALDGTTLAAHSAGADILAARRLVVERGAVGTDAATHSDGATVTRWDSPAPLRNLNVAIAVAELAQQGALYARTAGEGETLREVSGRGLATAYAAAQGYRRPMTVYS